MHSGAASDVLALSEGAARDEDEEDDPFRISDPRITISYLRLLPDLVVFSGEDGELRLPPDLVVGGGTKETRFVVIIGYVSSAPHNLVIKCSD
ncbi:hypothetical protein L1987_05529 [Smallanthus sonchifolius]|uniref:Uncharacterized protein n=1 Tax=Smallanthus sonchifolius TaxID=185202 RepID=A0ACB9JVM8_9ASTR|nr:hypothetical protein L1987_05529 [Smallanthus sonchifolius]